MLGIDPGIARTGYGLITREGGRLLYVVAGVIRPKGKTLSERLLSLREQLGAVIGSCSPTEAAVEDIFHHRNARTAFVLGQARGAILLSLAAAGLEPVAYPPAMVKRVVAGSGRAEKAQICRAVSAILGGRGIAGLPVDSPSDAYDGLALAICHVLAGRARQMLGKQP